MQGVVPNSPRSNPLTVKLTTVKELSTADHKPEFHVEALAFGKVLKLKPSDVAVACELNKDAKHLPTKVAHLLLGAQNVGKSTIAEILCRPCLSLCSIDSTTGCTLRHDTGSLGKLNPAVQAFSEKLSKSAPAPHFQARNSKKGFTLKPLPFSEMAIFNMTEKTIDYVVDTPGLNDANTRIEEIGVGESTATGNMFWPVDREGTSQSADTAYLVALQDCLKADDAKVGSITLCVPNRTTLGQDVDDYRKMAKVIVSSFRKVLLKRGSFNIIFLLNSKDPDCWPDPNHMLVDGDPMSADEISDKNVELESAKKMTDGLASDLLSAFGELISVLPNGLQSVRVSSICAQPRKLIGVAHMLAARANWISNMRTELDQCSEYSDIVCSKSEILWNRQIEVAGAYALPDRYILNTHDKMRKVQGGWQRRADAINQQLVCIEALVQQLSAFATDYASHQAKWTKAQADILASTPANENISPTLVAFIGMDSQRRPVLEWKTRTPEHDHKDGNVVVELEPVDAEEMEVPLVGLEAHRLSDAFEKPLHHREGRVMYEAKLKVRTGSPVKLLLRQPCAPREPDLDSLFERMDGEEVEVTNNVQQHLASLQGYNGDILSIVADARGAVAKAEETVNQVTGGSNSAKKATIRSELAGVSRTLEAVERLLREEATRSLEDASDLISTRASETPSQRLRGLLGGFPPSSTSSQDAERNANAVTSQLNGMTTPLGSPVSWRANLADGPVHVNHVMTTLVIFSHVASFVEPGIRQLQEVSKSADQAKRALELEYEQTLSELESAVQQLQAQVASIFGCTKGCLALLRREIDESALSDLRARIHKTPYHLDNEDSSGSYWPLSNFFDMTKDLFQDGLESLEDVGKEVGKMIVADHVVDSRKTFASLKWQAPLSVYQGSLCSPVPWLPLVATSGAQKGAEASNFNERTARDLVDLVNNQVQDFQRTLERRLNELRLTGVPMLMGCTNTTLNEKATSLGAFSVRMGEVDPLFSLPSFVGTSASGLP